ncbi:hypothetical protein [Mycobacterium riyadhense]|uniref:hypothetical protein n=1 Tax=Mycobacterium riyadhense TaxID=486698 RepID=UPI00195638A4|nr:hypothetical protein [Mycobacterium riyadhense]
MTSVDSGSTPAETLLATPAPDDAGAETADRYEWQAMMATADALSMYFQALDDDGNLIEGFEFTVICEHHEDWAIVKGTVAEIVSGKHREASVGPFSTHRQLFDDGGLLHMFDRWSALGKKPLCRLVTTAGLSKAAAKLTNICERLRVDLATPDADIDEVVSSVVQVIVALKTTKEVTPAPESEGAIRAFLAALMIQDSEARRDHVPDMAPHRYGRQIAERLGHREAGGAIWDSVLGLVRQRMRAAGPSKGGSLPTVLGVPHDSALASRQLRNCQKLWIGGVSGDLRSRGLVVGR